MDVIQNIGTDSRNNGNIPPRRNATNPAPMPNRNPANPARRVRRRDSTPAIMAMPMGGANTESTWFVTSNRSLAPCTQRIRNVQPITVNPVSTVATRAMTMRRPGVAPGWSART